MVSTPNTISVEWVGDTEVVGNLRRAASSLDVRSKVLIGHLVDDMVEAAKDLVAKDEEKVMRSIRKEVRRNDWYLVADRLGDRDEVAVYLEIGTHKMAPRPYMVPATRLTLASGGLYKASKAAGGLLGQTNI